MTDLYERLLLLKKMPLFSEVFTEDLEAIAEVMEEDRFQSGDIVFRKGDPADRMYIVVDGRVGVTLSPALAADDFITHAAAGECFGEMSLLDGLPRSASAVVLEDTEVLTLEKAKLHTILLQHPTIAIGMLAHLSQLVRNANASKTQ